jgi:Leucine carboxyl methyltransferase
LGCGYDTFVFNIFSEANGQGNFRYFETDLKEVVEKKVVMIKNSEGLNTAFVGENLEYLSDCFIKSENYSLFDADLTNLTELEEQLTKAGVDTS